MSRWAVCRGAGAHQDEARVDPDPRFVLANERTFLAWVRTALALLAGALAVRAFDLDIGRGGAVLPVVLCLVSCIVAISGWRGWRRNELALRRGRSLPMRDGLVWVVVAVAGLAIATAWIVIAA